MLDYVDFFCEEALLRIHVEFPLVGRVRHIWVQGDLLIAEECHLIGHGLHWVFIEVILVGNIIAL